MSDFYTLGLGFDTTPAQKGAADLARVVTASAGAIAEQAKALKSSEAQLASYANAQVRAAQSSQVRSFGGDPYKNAVAAASAIRDQADAERVRTASMAERIKVFEQTQYRVKLLTTEIDKQTASAERLSGAGSSGGSNAGMLGVAKSFGLATKQIKEFAHFGAGVFAGDILAKTLGFSSVLGLVTAASDLVAKSLIDIGTTFRDNFFPEIKKAKEELEAQTAATNELIAAHKALVKELAGPGLTVGGRFIKTAGIQGQDLSRLQDAAIAAQGKLVNDKGTGLDAQIEGSLLKYGPQYTELKRLREEIINQVVTLAEKLQYQATVQENLNYNDQQAIDLAKERTEEFRKQAAAAKAAGYDPRGGSGGIGYLHELGEGPESFSAEKAASAFGSASAQSRALGPMIVGAFRTSAQLILTALPQALGGGGGSPTRPGDIVGDPRWDGIGDRRSAQAIEDMRTRAELQRQELEMAQEAESVFNSNVGYRIAQGFEDAVLSGNKLRDVLKGILQDIERMVFRQMVTNPLGEGFGNILSGLPWGGAPAGQTPIATGGGQQHSMAGGGGGNVTVIMNVHTPDASSFNQSQRQISEDLSRRIRR